MASHSAPKWSLPNQPSFEKLGKQFHDSAIHRAVLSRNHELTRVLMQLDADARKGFWPHRDATSAYAIAVDREYREIVATIEQEEDNRRTRHCHGASCTHSAIEALWQAIGGNQTSDAIALMEAEPALVGACDVYGVTPLHLAAWQHDPVMVGWLLDHGASPNAPAMRAALRCDEPPESGKTPLDFAAIVAGWAVEGRDRTFYFMENARVEPDLFYETARLLIDNGGELTARAVVALGDLDALLRMHREEQLQNDIQVYRGGLLSIATRVNRLDVVATLLNLGFDPNEAIVTDDGTQSSGMPLWFATMCGRYEIAELLLASGANANSSVCACGDSLSHCTAEDETFAVLLRKYGARLTVEQLPDGDLGRVTAKAILAGTMPASSLNVDEPTLPDLAEQMLWATGDVEITRMCLTHIVRACNDSWWNYVLIHVGESNKLKLILEHGVDPNVVGDGGFTMLHHIATNYHERADRVTLATMLLDAGASLTIRDPLLNSTPLGWACRWGRIDLVQLYLHRGAESVELDAETWATPLAWAKKGGHQQIVPLLRPAES